MAANLLKSEGAKEPRPQILKSLLKQLDSMGKGSKKQLNQLLSGWTKIEQLVYNVCFCKGQAQHVNEWTGIQPSAYHRAHDQSKKYINSN